MVKIIYYFSKLSLNSNIVQLTSTMTIGSKLTSSKDNKLPKRYRHISKQPKNAREPSETSIDTDDTEETIQILSEHSWVSPQELISLLKQAHQRFNYGIDTLVVCMMLLREVNFKVEERKARLLVATLLMMGGKVHQFRTPQFMELAIWGQFTFGKEQLVAAEGQLLIHFGFKVPTALYLDSISDAEIQLSKLQSSFLDCSLTTSFQ